jgi:ABC-type Mn2+/Zn2+ transport system permease subunit
MLEPLGEEFMRRALAEAVLIGVAGGLLGCWVILHRLSYATESLAHSMLPGLVLAALAGASPLVGGSPAILVAALAAAALTRAPGIEPEVAIAVVVTSLVGLGALLALSADSPPGLESILFGDVLGVSDGDLTAAAAMALAAAVGALVLHGRLLAAGFDRDAARRLGAAPSLTEAALMALIAAAVLVAVQGVGNLLVVAVFVAPAAAARELTDRIGPMIATSVAIAVLGGVAGLYLSYYVGTAAGASIALVLVAAYLLAALAAAAPALCRRGRTARGAEATIAP